MTDLEVIYQLSEVYNRVWNMSQWWASISFMIIAISHFTSHKLNKFLVGIILILYMAFSIWLYRFSTYNVSIIFGLLQDLQNLIDSGVPLSQGAIRYLAVKEDWITPIFINIAQAGTFIATISYVIYCQLDISKKGDG